jgi:hypothetical protein
VDVPDGYAGALLLTLAVELVVYGAGLGVRGLLAGLVGNLVSHPLIFIVLPVPAWVGEPIAWAVELAIATVIVAGERRFEQVLVTVLAANVLSMLLGAVVF